MDLNALVDQTLTRVVVQKANSLPASMADAVHMALEESSVSDFLAPKTVNNEQKVKGKVAMAGVNIELKEIQKLTEELQKSLAAANANSPPASKILVQILAFDMGNQATGE